MRCLLWPAQGGTGFLPSPLGFAITQSSSRKIMICKAVWDSPTEAVQ